jgi:nucleotide-binding universal stress UspA family protein
MRLSRAAVTSAAMSPIKSILLHVDNSPNMAARLHAANELARLHDACITALFAVTPLFVRDPYSFDEVAAASAQMPDLDALRKERSRNLYLLTRGESMPNVRWAEVTREPVLEAFAHQALHADLLVLGQHEAGQQAQDVPASFPEAVLMASGKPGWIIPNTGVASATPRTVLVAWKPSKEAARAVSAALPLLQRAQDVHIAHWARGSNDGATGGLDIEQYLQAHGLQPTMHRHAGEPSDLGERLLSLATKLGAELVVMGCYGRGRMRELVLGGVTRSVLKSMNIPVLMAH